MNKIVYFVIVLFISGCVSTSTGVVIDQEKINTFQAGITTETEVVAALGKPLSVKDSSDGQRTLMYYFYESQAHGIIGLGGKVNMDTTTTSLLFDKSGKLISHETTKSKYTQ